MSDNNEATMYGKDKAPAIPNGQDGEPVASGHSHRRKWERPGGYIGAALYVFDRYGVLALVCGALMFFVWKQAQWSREAAKQAHTVFAEALGEQTKAVKESTQEQRKMTEALIRTETKIDAHLKSEDNRHHR